MEATARTGRRAPSLLLAPLAAVGARRGARVDGISSQRSGSRLLLGALLIVTVMIGALGLSSSSASASIPANFFTVSDSGGANDEPGQKDLTQFGRDDTDPTSYKIFWSWDETDQWTGAGQTGDACALFDTDGDSFINFVVCGQVYNPTAGSVVETAGSPYAFSCNDTKIDNCGGPSAPLTYTAADIKTGALTAGDPLPSPPADLATNTDPFILGSDTPFDTTLEMIILKSYLPPNAVLVNVCSFPSIGGGFNNDPSDCIVNPGGGFLRINKVAPAGTTQDFSFGVDPGGLTRTITGSGQTSAISLPISPPGTPASVTETIPAGWILDGAQCTVEDGPSTGTRSGATISDIAIQSGKVTDCTFTNVRPPALALTKTSDAGAISAGSAIGFTLSVTNNGAGPAQGVQITDTLPTDAGLSWTVDGGTAAGTCSIAVGVLTCDVGTLGAGATATVHISSPTTPATCGAVDNTGNVTATNGTSPAPANSSVTVRCPDLDLTKVADEAVVSAGDQIGFVITVTNSGTGSAAGVTVGDTLPTGTGVSWSIDAAGSDTGCSLAANVLSCSFGTLAPNASKHVHVVSATTAASCKAYPNTATADATNHAQVQAQASATVNCGDIGLTKVADDATVSAGDQIGFVITATNTGAGEARTVTVTDNLPTTAGLSWSVAAGSDAGCSIAGSVLTCNWGTLAANASKSVHVTSPTTSASCATIDNQASVSTSNDGSDQANASTTVNCGDIGVTKVADDATVSAGDQIGFVITATNTGAGEARTVTVTDNLPATAGLSWSVAAGSDAGCSIAGAVLTCNWGTLASGASKSVHITSATTSASCATIPNQASVSTSNDGSAQANASTTVNCGDISLTKTADDASVSAGDQIGFVITATNTGAGEARTVTVTDNLPTTAGVSWAIAPGSDAGCSIAGTVLTCNWGTLAPNASKSVRVTSPTTSASCATIDNQASVSTSNDGSAQANASTTVNCGDIALSKTADAATVSAGDQIGFVITATNDGSGEVRDVTVTDNLPTTAGLTWSIAAGSDAGCSIAATVLTCNWGTLASKASKSVHITSPTSSASCATIPNEASVSTSNDGSAQAGASTTVNCGNIALTKVADAASVTAGSPIGFVIVATNNGSGEARTVTVTDNLPTAAGLSWSIAQGSDAGCSIAGTVLTCNWGTLAANASKSVHITSPTTTASCATIPNQASVSTSNDGSAQANDSTAVRCGAIAIDKTGPATAQAGQPVLYTLAVTNPGDVAFLAQDVSVTDALCEAPPLLVSTNGDASPGRLDPGDRWTYTCTVRTLVGQTLVDNIGVATGTDSNGNVVQDSDPAVTQLTQPPAPPPPPPPPPPPAAVVAASVPNAPSSAPVASTGAARMAGPSRCVSRSFVAKVSGRDIARVMFTLDGKKVKTVRSAPGRTVFSVRINPRGQSYRAHRVNARVTFKASANTRSRTLRYVYLRCARVAPKFTG